jgi:hypothetical protein|uniref:Protein kinase domain-containing protein n=1 Tax=viral metagenome TaxID=1070528 RepID=A0A6C0J741_9ZZZZ
MEENFDPVYGESILYNEEFDCIWKDDYMEAMQDKILTAKYIKKGSSCNLKRLKEKIKKNKDNIEFIGSGAYASAYMIDENNTEYEHNTYVVKNCAYQEDEHINDIEENVNCEVRMIKHLNNFIFNSISPHILLYIKHAQCTACNNPSMRIVTEVCRSNVEELSNEEWPYLKNMDIIIFQVLYTLHCIQSVYPEWRHNDLKIDNVFIDKVAEDDYYYKIQNKFFKISTDMFAKISDFGLAHLPNIIINKAVYPNPELDWDPTTNGMRPTQNRYYDMHMFLNEINIEYVDDYAKSTLDTNMVNLIKDMLPDQYRSDVYVKGNKLKTNKKTALSEHCLLEDIEYKQPIDALMNYFGHFEVSCDSIPEDANIFSLN